MKDKNRKKLEKSNKQLKKFFKFVDGNGKVRYPDFDPKYTKLKESKPKDLTKGLNNGEALDLTYTYRPTNKKDPILKCKKCLKEWLEITIQNINQSIKSIVTDIFLESSRDK